MCDIFDKIRQKVIVEGEQGGKLHIERVGVIEWVTGKSISKKKSLIVMMIDPFSLCLEDLIQL